MSDIIEPEIREFIRELRAGKSCNDAMQTYCWAKCVLPVTEQAWRDGHYKSVAWGASMADAAAGDKFDEGGSDAEIAAAFRAGLAMDRERGILWRAMEKDERPTHGDLLRSMNVDSLMKAGEIFGYARVAQAFTSR